MPEGDEAERLEQLWSSGFGDAYVERNLGAANGRQPFWDMILETYAPSSVLEVGCNIGANLQWIAKRVPARNVYGSDINEAALEQLRVGVRGVNATWARARELPFRDDWFDLVFTTGVLIHQPPEQLPGVMSEIVRCSRRYVLCGEYHSADPVEVPYRGERDALFKRDFGSYYRELFPELRLLDTGFLPSEQGWDDVTWWMLEKPTGRREETGR